MTKDALFSIWAPRGGVWTPWAKGVVFAHHPNVEMPEMIPAERDMSWLPKEKGLAVVLDLPGVLGVEMALRLAMEGFRPVPLYNAVPAPYGIVEAVQVREILHGLAGAANELFRLGVVTDAPPAFMLDATRRVGTTSALPGQFDNRSICFPTDFPSATFLGNHGISSVLLIQETQLLPQADLSHTLLRWEKAGIRILSRPLAAEGLPEDIRIPRPSGFRGLWHRLLAGIGLRRSPLGGYGGTVPFPIEGGFAGG